MRDMTLFLAPIAAGYDYRANGQSRLGPFTSTGQILLPKGGRATIDIAALNVAGSVARGALRSDPGGFSGALDVGGGGLAGTLGFAPVGGDQQIEAHLSATNASLPGAAADRGARRADRRHDPARRGAHQHRRDARGARAAERVDQPGAAQRAGAAGQWRGAGARVDGRAARPCVRIRHRSPTSRRGGSA